MTLQTGYGIDTIASPRSFAETVSHLENLLAAKGLTLFAKIDFTDDAKKSGLDMPPTQLLIFGNPKAGTPVMLAAPSSGLDLPLKILVSQDGGGKVWISYNTPEYLAERHAIPADLMQNIAGITPLARAAAAAS